jgi:hypothetical protein
MAEYQEADNRVIHFNKDDYNRLMKHVVDDGDDIATRFLKPRSGLMLDASLGAAVKPGSTKWAPVQNLQASAKGFGESVNTEMVKLTGQWNDFVRALKGAADAFQQNGDLATMSAQDFIEKHPDFNPGS